MTFLAPAWLLLSGLAIAILVLHMRRRRQLDVPSVLLWRLIDNTGAPRRSLRWPPPSLLLFLQLLVVVLVALALAQPLFGANRGDAEHTIFVLDASASMRATDVSPSRFDKAIGALIENVNAIPEGSGNRISLVTVSARPRIEVARQFASSGILPIIEDLAATDGPANWAGARALIASLISPDETPSIVVLTDGADGDDAILLEGFTGASVERVVFADPEATNFGLLAELRSVEPDAGQWQLTGTVIFVGVAPPATVEVEVLFRPDGEDGFLAWDEIEVALPETEEGEVANPGGLVQVAFELDLQLPGAGSILARLPLDSGPYDNAVRFVVREVPRTARILYLGEPTLPLIAVFQAFENVELLAADELPGNDRAFDLVIVDGVTVPRKPDTNVLWVGAGRVENEAEPNRIRTPSVSGWDAAHPLSTGVGWAAIAPEIGYWTPRLAGATVLVESGGVPLIQARTTPNGREVRIAFDLAGSGWSQQSGFPVFISNLVSWLEADFGTLSLVPCRVGVSCPIEARLISGTVFEENDEAIWSIETVGEEFLLPGIDRSFVPERAGFYRLEAGDETRLIVVESAIEGEIDLVPQNEADATSLSSGSSGIWWWLLAIALIALVLETWFAGRDTEQFLRPSGLHRTNPLSTRRRIMLGVRIASIVFLLAALVGLPWLGREPVEDVVVVVSSGLGPGGQNAERDRILSEVEANLGDAGAGARGGLVTAGDTTRIAADLGGAVGIIGEDTAGGRPGANLEEAVLLAAAMVSSDRQSRIILATDGNETEGEIAMAVAALAERGLTVDIVPMTELPPGEVLVESITAPPHVYDGDLFFLEAVLYSQQAGVADVTISRAGEIVLDQAVELLAGRTMVETVVPAGDEGNLLIEVTIDAPGDTFAQNNVNGLIVKVEPSPSIAVVTPQPPLGEYFAQALTIQGLSADILLPSEAPTTLDGWLKYEAVVLMNVPAIAFDTENQEYLEQLVRVYGRGLLILGGQNTFGPGGYFQTPFEELSPLSARIPHEASQVAIMFVLDRSGSMNAAVGDVTRLDIAKQATVTAISLLNPDARVGVVVFDHQATVIVPVTERRDEQLVAEALAQLIEGGGTNMYPGLAAAIEELLDVDAATRHIVVMTDGLTQGADFPALMEVAAAAGITVSSVGIGAGADDIRLKQIADLGGGTYHSTGDFRALPAILSQETLLLANSPFEEQIVPVSWVNRDAEFLAGLPELLPPIYAYVRTTAKPNADIHLTIVDDEGSVLPLMASWRYGNGHVLALATHGAGAGTADWIQMPEYPLMWSQIIRHFLPDAQGPGLHVGLDRVGDVVLISADVLDPAGVPLEGRTVTAVIDDNLDEILVLPEIEPGRYQLGFPVDTGSYRVDVTAGDLVGDGSIYIAYPARFNFSRADFDKLRALAAATGGALLLGDDPLFSDERQWVAKPGWRIWAVVALLLFMLDLAVRHAPSIFGLRKSARRPGPASAMPA